MQLAFSSRSGYEMKHVVLSVIVVSIAFTGCGAADPSPPPFTGHWRKYEGENGEFVEFKNGQITLGDKSGSQTGNYTYQPADETEPLYRVEAVFPSGTRNFQLYYESDTIDLLSDDKRVEGMYEIIVQLAPIQD